MTTSRWFAEQDSPVGRLRLVAAENGLCAIDFLSRGSVPPPDGWREDAKRLMSAASQLDAYFAGELREFDLLLAPEGTEFQQRVWNALREIPYGETTSYGELARRLGNPQASRAVGLANGRNPLPIVVPCHRVIGKDGTLTGYAGGLAIKKALLSLEGRQATLVGG